MGRILLNYFDLQLNFRSDITHGSISYPNGNPTGNSCSAFQKKGLSENPIKDDEMVQNQTLCATYRKSLILVISVPHGRVQEN